MKDFSKISFKWIFRDYQQKMLDNANQVNKEKIQLIINKGHSVKNCVLFQLPFCGVFELY